MAKHVTRRSYKKRASKKRRTIRKLKKTMRRKMQRGGNLGVLTPVFLLFAVLFANNPIVTKGLKIAELVIGGGDNQGGGNKRLNQMGGGQLSNALDKLRETIQKDNISNLSDEERNGLLICIGKLNDGEGIPDTVIGEMGDTPQTGGAYGLSLPSALTGAFSSLKDKGAAAAAAAQEKAATAASAAAKGLNDLKDTATKTFMANIGTQIDKVNAVIISKVSNMRDEGKRGCMKLILSYGIRLIKAKLSSVTMENIKKAMALNATAAANLVKENGDDNVHIIEIKKNSGFSNDIDQTSSEQNFKLFEDKLRAKLRENDWPADEAEFNVGISSYNNAKIESDPNLRTSTSGVSDMFFIFALYSGMITSIEFTDENKKTISLSGPAAFFDKYTRGNPYYIFKSNLFDILSKTHRITKSIQVKITTDFSKIPDYLPVKKAVLKSANRETAEYYRSVIKQLADSKEAAKTAKNDWAGERVRDALKLAQKTVDAAFDRAKIAYLAAFNAGIPENEIINPQSSKTN